MREQVKKAEIFVWFVVKKDVIVKVDDLDFEEVVLFKEMVFIIDGRNKIYRHDEIKNVEIINKIKAVKVREQINGVAPLKVKIDFLF